jgi:predicted flap endonuclease-1-like 5' DNA nuclease
VPFLLGLLLGWYLWAKFKTYYADLIEDFGSLNTKYIALENEHSKCKSEKNEYANELLMLKSRIRELETAGKTSEIKTSSPQAFATGIKADKFVALKDDNLQVIEGIGPKMNEFLRNNGIFTWADLASKKAEDLKAMLLKEGNKYLMIDPATWPKQALLARDGKWEELIAMQKNLSTAKSTSKDEKTPSKVESILVKLGIIKKWKANDLKAIEGIGPKIEKLLNNANINTWLELSQTPVEKIQKILDDAGPNYSLADPGTWPRQAKLAAEDKWSELEEYQVKLIRGK